MNKAPLVLFLCLFLAASGLVAQTHQDVRTSTGSGSAPPFQYLIAFPPDYDQARKAPWTAVFFFHGSGERGINIEMVSRNGPPRRIEDGASYPAVVISPQCSGRWWNAADLEGFIEEMVTTWNLSRADLRLTGLSMGGYAVWELAVRHPERYSRIVPICGAGRPELAYRLKNLSVWAFHGALDETVPVSGTTDMVKALEAEGGRPRVTIYPDLAHDSWTRTYEDPEVEDWLFGVGQPTKSAER